jgi:excisionase family DNA binding protein
MASPATSLHDMPEWLTAAEAAGVLRLDAWTVRRMLRDDEIPGAVKLPGRFWRVPRESIKALLAGQSGQKTPAQQRAAVLGADTVEFLHELAAAAPPLSDAQKDTIRAAFRGT